MFPVAGNRYGSQDIFDIPHDFDGRRFDIIPVALILGIVRIKGIRDRDQRGAYVAGHRDRTKSRENKGIQIDAHDIRVAGDIHPVESDPASRIGRHRDAVDAQVGLAAVGDRHGHVSRGL